MSEITTEQMAEEMISIGIEGKHHEVERINSISEFFIARTAYNATKKVAQEFRNLANSFWKQYTENIEDHINSVEILINYKKMKQCADFYFEECNILKQSIKEYRAHLFNGGFFSALLGYNRRDYE